MDATFRALNDATRRAILDALRESDGQTSSALEARFPQMTRFGVLKHLQVLEAASLITTRKEGRFKYHYLNVIPLQEIADRWISRFRAPWAETLSDLKHTLERNPIMTTTPKHIYVSVIKTTPEKLWEALTSASLSPLYYYGGSIDTDLKPGAPYSYRNAEGQLFVTGDIIKAEKPSTLVMSFSGHWAPGMEADAPSRVTYEILQQGKCCRLTLTHEFDAINTTYHISGGGWPGILAGLKTLLETGQPLNYNPMAA